MGDEDQRDSVDEEFEAVVGRTPKRVAKIAAALAVVVTLIGYGVGIGTLLERVKSNEDDIAKLQTAKDSTVEALHRLDVACRERANKVADAASDSIGSRDETIGQLQGSIVALSTEMRVRHGVPEYNDVIVRPSGERISRGEREKMAAKQADQALRSAIMSAPSKGDDPLDGLAF